MPFGGVLTVGRSRLQYFTAKNMYRHPACVAPIPKEGIDEFTDYDFIDKDFENSIFRMLLGSNSTTLYLVAFNQEEMGQESSY